MRREDPEKTARTESLFREVNERIAESAAGFDADLPEFICECGDATCTHRVEATLDEYEEVRADGATFMLARGHADTDIEHVVADRGRFQIVEKLHQRVRALVKRMNPRAAEA
jgi:hypothetical protein